MYRDLSGSYAVAQINSFILQSAPGPGRRLQGKKLGSNLQRPLEAISVVDDKRYIGQTRDAQDFFTDLQPKELKWYEGGHDMDDLGGSYRSRHLGVVRPSGHAKATVIHSTHGSIT
jgi:hypothetical protein